MDKNPRRVLGASAVARLREIYSSDVPGSRA